MSGRNKVTYVFDKLDNVLGNYMDDLATAEDVVMVAKMVNDYLLEHAHPHDIIIDSDERTHRI
jgi:hypothetical protein